MAQLVERSLLTSSEIQGSNPLIVSKIKTIFFGQHTICQVDWPNVCWPNASKGVPMCGCANCVCGGGRGTNAGGGRVTKRGGTNFQSIHCLVNMDGWHWYWPNPVKTAFNETWPYALRDLAFLQTVLMQVPTKIMEAPATCFILINSDPLRKPFYVASNFSRLA